MMEKLKDTWEDLVNLVKMTVILMKFAEDSYDETWDEGKGEFPEHSISARVKYDLSDRDIEQLGDNMLLDAVILIRKKDLDALNLDIATQDHFKIENKVYRITKLRPKIIAGQNVGYEIGIKEIIKEVS